MSFSARNNHMRSDKAKTTSNLPAMTKVQWCLTTDDSPLDWEEVDCRMILQRVTIRQNASYHETVQVLCDSAAHLRRLQNCMLL